MRYVAATKNQCLHREEVNKDGKVRTGGKGTEGKDVSIRAPGNT